MYDYDANDRTVGLASIFIALFLSDLMFLHHLPLTTKRVRYWDCNDIKLAFTMEVGEY
jgi:hypothetical protein